jgi:hypothetical protein
MIDLVELHTMNDSEDFKIFYDPVSRPTECNILVGIKKLNGSRRSNGFTNSVRNPDGWIVPTVQTHQ